MAPSTTKRRRGRPRASDIELGASIEASVRKTTRAPSSPQAPDEDDELSREINENEQVSFSARKKPSAPPSSETPPKRRGRPRRVEAQVQRDDEDKENRANGRTTPPNKRQPRKRVAEPEVEPTEEPPPKRRATRRSTAADEIIAPEASSAAQKKRSQKGKGASRVQAEDVSRAGRNKGSGAVEVEKEAQETLAQRKPADDTAEPGATKSGARRSARERRSAVDFPMWLGPNESISFTASTPREDIRQAGGQHRLASRLSIGDTSISEERSRSKVGAPTIDKALESQAIENTSKPKRKRGRPSKGPVETAGEDTEQVDQSVAVTVPTDDGPAQQRSRTRSKRQGPRKSPDPGEASITSVPKPRGRPPRKSSGQNETEEEPQPKHRRPKAKRREPEVEQDEQREDDSDSENERQEARQTKYRQLETRVRNIARVVVKDKWQPLDEASVDLANNMLYDAFHPVLMRLQDRPQRYQQAHNVLSITAGRIERKLRDGLPFPKPSARLGTTGGPRGGAGHEDELDYERSLKAIKAMEGQLTALLDAEKLLTSTVNREEAELEREYERLRELEKNARAEARTWKDRSKRAHSLAPEPRTADKIELAARHTRLEIADGESFSGGIFQKLENEELKDVSRQVSSHMTSMKSNLDQIEGVASQAMMSQGIVQQVLQKHLDQLEVTEALTGVKSAV